MIGEGSGCAASLLFVEMSLVCSKMFTYIVESHRQTIRKQLETNKLHKLPIEVAWIILSKGDILQRNVHIYDVSRPPNRYATLPYQLIIYCCKTEIQFQTFKHV